MITLLVPQASARSCGRRVDVGDRRRRPPPGAGPTFSLGAAGKLGVERLEDGVTHDAVELGGAADRVVDAADAAGGGIGGAVGAMLALPERMIGVGHGRAQEVAGDAQPRVGPVVDGDRLQLVDAGVELRDRVRIEVLPEHEVAAQVEFVFLLGRQLVVHTTLRKRRLVSFTGRWRR